MRPVSVSRACGGVYGNYAQTKNMIRYRDTRYALNLEGKWKEWVLHLYSGTLVAPGHCLHMFFFSYFLSLVHMSQG